MTNLSDAQAALAAANIVLVDLNALRDMLEKSQTSAAPVSPDIMKSMRATIVDVTAAIAAVQTVVTDLGG